MTYFPDMEKAWQDYTLWLNLMKERNTDTSEFEHATIEALTEWTQNVSSAVEETEHNPAESSNLEEIRRQRPDGPRRLKLSLTAPELEDKLLGAWLGRAAGCILGIPSEGMTKQQIKTACDNLALPYPLSSYWEMDPQNLSQEHLHYNTTPRKEFLKKNINHIGADDDLAYTILGLLILEKYAVDFSTSDVGKAWLQYLPIACTAEEVALNNLKNAIPANDCGALNNPFRDWIGADIRSDPWGYAAPGYPEKAAEFAYRDAYLSHRGTGIHGAMFFSAVIAAAFAVNDPIKALETGLAEIPRECRLAHTVNQTLQWCERDKNWDKTTERILEHFSGMSRVHTVNNAALTVAGLYYGGGDFEKTVTLTVMGGLDTDCTAATAGSIMGAFHGAKRLPAQWIEPLGDLVVTYLKGYPTFSSRDIAQRFARISSSVLNQ